MGLSLRECRVKVATPASAVIGPGEIVDAVSADVV
jgi:hypothetical protein